MQIESKPSGSECMRFGLRGQRDLGAAARPGADLFAMTWLDRVTQHASEQDSVFGHVDTVALPQDLAEFDRRQAELVYAHSTEAIMITDGQNRIVAVNPAFCRMTGYAASDVLGMEPSMLHSPHHSPSFYREMRRQLEADGQWEGEVWSRRKSGESFPCWFSMACVRDAASVVQRRVSLFSDQSTRKASEALIWRQANFDGLTQLPNRNMLCDRLAQECKKVDAKECSVAVLAVHLDHLENIKEGYPQPWVERLVREAAQRLVRSVRSTDTVARVADDCFVVLLTGTDGAARASQAAQNILHRLAQPLENDASMVAMSGSIGITIYPGDAGSGDELLQNAQQAMYSACHRGGNQFDFFTPALQRAAQQRANTVRELRTAVAEKQFCLQFQPLVALDTGRIVKAEALVRWNHPERGMVGPGEFITLAEEHHLIHDIGDWVFKEAAAWTHKWRAELAPGLQVSVNKSPLQFSRTHNHAADWIAHLCKLGLPGEAIALEITEGLLLNSTSAIDDCLRSYRDAGIQVAIDDFGTGYSSLSYLKRFSLDILKIDRSFVSNLAPDSSDLALCQAMVAMAHALGLKVVAEGIETAQQRDLLAAMGCDYGQGYLFSKPLSPEQFEQALARNACVV
ncbi:putative bifunctional diguanylate cyclase/phosphodiesterase [Variovorax sp. HJSM1_2]|uniref:putative bifunctional diguanylate cyclase/phosphodiesterase n=1 Tax=Variovorax sp. HJSM1_2 TaxID=3366263 RepID=UPI003BD39FC6